MLKQLNALEDWTATPQDNNNNNNNNTGTPASREELETKLRAQEFLQGVCEICLSDYIQESQISGSFNPECSHVFHTDCILKWLERKQTCPCCRASYIVDEVVDP
jgi:SUMO ligase MMS21 Smc5/6 complex component